MNNIWTLDFRQDVNLVLEIVEQPWCETLLLNDLDCEILFVIILHIAPMDCSKLTLA